MNGGPAVSFFQPDSPARIVTPNAHQSPVQMHINDAANAHQGIISNAHQMHIAPVNVSAETAFAYDSQLFRLEASTVNGKPIVKRAVRFVNGRKRATNSLGPITEELQEKLRQRPGKGRTASARAEADRSRLLAQSLAKRLRGAKTGRSRNASKRGKGKRKASNSTDTGRGRLLSVVPNVPRNDDTAYVSEVA